MKKSFYLLVSIILIHLISGHTIAQEKINVVATISVYGDIASYIGGDKVEVKSIVRGDQDAHFVDPKPSYAVWLSNADLYIETGLDLELWAPALIDKSGNPDIRSGQDGYVAASRGVQMLEVPDTPDRSQGDVHIYGNPHIYTSPLNAKIIAGNITTGLSKVSPAHKKYFSQRLEQFNEEIDNRLFGKELAEILGGDILTQLAQSGQLIQFLNEKSYKGRVLSEYLGGWMLDILPLREKPIVAYHKNWAYFERLFQVTIIGYVEPKPNIPPPPRHVEALISKMRENNIRIILAANYFDERKVREIAKRVNAAPVIVPLSVGGAEGVDTYIALVDYWVRSLNEAQSPDL